MSKQKKLTRIQEEELYRYNVQRKKDKLPLLTSFEAMKREKNTPKGTLSFKFQLPPGREMPVVNSVDTNTDMHATAYKSHMDPRNLAKEKPEVAAATIAKSKKIAIGYNKSSYMYIDDGIDTKDIGKK
jgi:hypothetical protein